MKIKRSIIALLILISLSSIFIPKYTSNIIEMLESISSTQNENAELESSNSQSETQIEKETLSTCGCTEASPHEINNAIELENIRTALSCHYKLMVDINIDDLPKAEGNINANGKHMGFIPIGLNEDKSLSERNVKEDFLGTFDGNGHTISNLIIDRRKPAIDPLDEFNYAGLFASLGTTGKVKDTNFKSVDISSQSYVGAVAGENKGQISGIYVEGVIKGKTMVGGITGRMLGGAVGPIENCHNNASVISPDGAVGNSIGGIVGMTMKKVEGCMNTGLIIGGTEIGGIAGQNNNNSTGITNCVNSGIVEGVSNVGGIVGKNFNAKIKSVLVTSYIQGSSSVGPICGTSNKSSSTVIAECVFDKQTTSYETQNYITDGADTGYLTEDLTKGALVGGLDSGAFTSINDYYPILTYFHTKNADLAGFYSLPIYIDNSETIKKVGKDILLVMDVYGQPLEWSSNKSEILAIEDNYAVVKSSSGGTIITLSAKLGDFSKSYRILSTFKVSFDFGDGSIEDPFLISTVNQFVDMGVDPTKHYRLIDSLDFKDYKSFDLDDSGLDKGLNPIGTATHPFTGSFIGGGHVLKNISINRKAEDNIGVFGTIGNGGTVLNVGIENAKIEGNNNVAILCGNNKGIIDSCYVSGYVKGNTSLGSIVGNNDKGFIVKSYSYAEVNTANLAGDFGGLIGLQYNYTGLTKNYYDGTTSKQFNPVGRVVTGTGILEAYKKTTAEMKTKSTYETWDFDTLWKIESSVNNGYPYLSNDLKGLKLNKSKAMLCVGESIKLKAVKYDPKIDMNNIVWTSSNQEVATVDSQGYVSAQKKGTSIIKVATADGEYESTCELNVNEDELTDEFLNTNGYELGSYTYEDVVIDITAPAGYDTILMENNGTFIQVPTKKIEVKTDGVHEFKIRASNSTTGAKTAIRIILVKIDKKAPENVAVKFIDKETQKELVSTTHNKPVEIDISASDVGSGVKKISYALLKGNEVLDENTQFVEYTGRFVIDYDYAGQLFVVAEDKLGHKTNEKEFLLLIKMSVPTLNVTHNSDDISIWNKKDITFTINASDRIAGISKVRYTIESENVKEGEFSPVYGEVKDATLTVSDEGQYKVIIEAVDVAGNVNVYEQIVKIDKTAPSIMNMIIKDRLTNKLITVNMHNKPVKIELSSKDMISGVSKIYYAIEERNVEPTEFIMYTSAILIEPDFNKDIHYYSEDLAGNKTAINKQTIILEDELPNITVTSNLTDLTLWSAVDVNLSVTAIDSKTDVNKVMWFTNTIPKKEGEIQPTDGKVENEEITFSEDGKYDVTISAVDGAGNVSSDKITLKIDKKLKPIIDIVTALPKVEDYLPENPANYRNVLSAKKVYDNLAIEQKNHFDKIFRDKLNGLLSKTILVNVDNTDLVNGSQMCCEKENIYDKFSILSLNTEKVKSMSLDMLSQGEKAADNILFSKMDIDSAVAKYNKNSEYLYGYSLDLKLNITDEDGNKTSNEVDFQGNIKFTLPMDIKSKKGAKLLYFDGSDVKSVKIDGIITSGVISFDFSQYKNGTYILVADKIPDKPINTSKPTVPGISGPIVTLDPNEHKAYFSSDKNGNYNIDNNITRDEVVSIFYKVVDGPTNSSLGQISLPFIDVNNNGYNYQYLQYLYDKGIIEGYEDNTFRLEQPIKRSEFAKILTRIFALNEEQQLYYKDVTSNDWFFGYVGAVTKIGYMQGYGDIFRPHDYMTKAEVIAIINRSLGRKTSLENLPSDAALKDVSKDHWAYLDIIEATYTHKYYYDEYGKEKWVK